MTAPTTYTDRSGQIVTGTPANASTVAAWDAAEYIGKDGLESADGNGADAAFVSARIPAWHALGTVFDRDLTAEDVLVAGHLGGWDVRKEQLVTASGADVPGKFAVVRTNPYTNEPEVIGATSGTGATVGSTYRPNQPEESLSLLAALQDVAEGRFETAGSLQGGRRIFVSMKLPQGMLIGGVDPIDRYVTLMDSFDGSSSLLLLDTPIRTVCRNTANAALRNHASKVSIWHTTNADKAISRIREALDITYAYDTEFESEAERMIQTATTEAEFVKLTRNLWPEPKADDSVRVRNADQRRQLELVQLFTGSETMSQIKGTRWAAYNAVTEYLDWYTPVGAKRDAVKVRAERTVTPGNRVGEIKEHAFDLLRVPA